MSKGMHGLHIKIHVHALHIADHPSHIATLHHGPCCFELGLPNYPIRLEIRDAESRAPLHQERGVSVSSDGRKMGGFCASGFLRLITDVPENGERDGSNKYVVPDCDKENVRTTHKHSHP
jgi:hypothetical protein